MKESPILMKGAMVRATLENRKTQTRRIVKGEDCKMVFYDDECDSWCGSNEVDFMNDPHAKVIKCPYGMPGDRLWVRETFQPLYADGYDEQTANWETGLGYAPNYAADGRLVDYVDPDGNIIDKCTPSIFMPRWASRITLEIEAVRVERLQEISVNDAQAEGLKSVSSQGFGAWKNYLFKTAHPRKSVKATDTEHRIVGYQDPVKSYSSLWESINGLGSWDANPYVWVIQFRRVK